MGIILFIISSAYLIKTSQDIVNQEKTNSLKNSVKTYEINIDDYFLNLKRIMQYSTEEELKKSIEPYEIMILNKEGEIVFSNNNETILGHSLKEKDFFSKSKDAFYLGIPHEDKKFNNKGIILANNLGENKTIVFLVSFEKLNDFLNKYETKNNIYLLDQENNLIISNQNSSTNKNFNEFCNNITGEILETKDKIFVSSKTEFTNYCTVIESKKINIIKELDKKEFFSIFFTIFLILVFSFFAHHIGKLFEKESIYYK